jgi:hypothetical protein
MGCSAVSGLGVGPSTRRKNKFVMTCHKRPRIWTDSLIKRHELKKMDVRFALCNVRSLAGSLVTVVGELTECRLDVVVVQ